VQAATLPQPIDGIFRELYQNIWGTLLRMTRERVQATWARDVTPVCEQSIARRYPFVGGSDGSATVDVMLQDFSAFFGRNGVIDQFVSKNLAPFTDPGPNGALVLSSQNGLSLGLSSQGMDQINRARRFRDLFFDSSGNLQVQFSLSPVYLDPRALSATLSMDQTRLVYRHQPPRPTPFSWPPVNAAGDASLVIKTTDGQTLDAQTSGAWAIFRLLGMAGKSAPGGNDQLLFTFTLGGIQASFGMRAGSVVNPFSVSDFAEFRCVPRL
jgi:type VI secretion system protein ImpL